jgi:hypothetical protein
VQALPIRHHSAYLAGFAKAMRVSSVIAAREAKCAITRQVWCLSARRHNRDLVRFLRQARAA